MSHQEASIKSILFALLANFGIAVTKTVAAVGVAGNGGHQSKDEQNRLRRKADHEHKSL